MNDQTTDTDKGTLYLIPVTLGKTPENNTIPDYVLDIIRRLDVMIVENVKRATRFLQWVGDTVPDFEIEFFRLDKNTTEEELESFMKPLLNGKDVGLMSEAGTPVIADPGSSLITRAHEQNIRVVALSGPSSIFLALMASGYNGQAFTFTGYLPIDKSDREDQIRKLEQESRQKNRTMLFMEAPHRNSDLIASVLKTCRPDTYFCVCASLTLPAETVISKKVREWKQQPLPDLEGQPAIFLLYANDPHDVT